MATIYVERNLLKVKEEVVNLQQNGLTKLSFKAYYSGQKVGEFYVDYKIEPSKYDARFLENNTPTPYIPSTPVLLNRTKATITRDVNITTCNPNKHTEIFKITAMIKEIDSSGKVISFNLAMGYCCYTS